MNNACSSFIFLCLNTLVLMLAEFFGLDAC